MMVDAAEEIRLQCNFLGYSVDAYLPKHNLGIEINDQGHNDRSADNEIERKENNRIGCKFIRIDPNKEGFDVNIELGRIQNYIVK